jgi:hypothetical protein
MCFSSRCLYRKLTKYAQHADSVHLALYIINPIRRKLGYAITKINVPSVTVTQPVSMFLFMLIQITARGH